MNNMRKWMSLVEAEEGKWYTDEELIVHFMGSYQQEWWESFMYVLDDEYLFTAQDAFQIYIKPELKPAWIVDMQMRPIQPRSVQFPVRPVSWKVVQGPEDPDE